MPSGRRRAALPLVLLALLAAPCAAAQGSLELAPEQPLASPLPLAPGEVVRLHWTVTNPAEEGFVVLLSATPPPGWNVTIVPPSFDLPPRAAGAVRTLALSLAVPEGARPQGYELSVHLAAVNSTTGTAFAQDLVVPLRVTHSALVLGAWRNPLPAPLDDAFGVFLLDLLFWAAVAGLFILLQDPVVKWLTRRAERNVGARIAVLLRKPVFLALVFFGATQAWDALPPSLWVDAGHRLLAALTILVTMYVVYKVFRGVLLYYIENIAAKTESELDDILMPVLEKVGGVVIVAAGGLYFLGTLGLDLSGFVAGGVVVSMVLAFAAQDTLSNFFAGLFLMLDRPFLRGDDIMLIGGGPLEGSVFRVDRVGLRTTRLYHYQRHQLVTVPNNDLAKNPVVNLHQPDLRLRATVRVGVAYGADPARVRAILERAALEHPRAEKGPGYEPTTYLEKFGESSVDFVLRFYHQVQRDRDRNAVPGEVQERILRDLAAAGIEIPFPQRVVTVRGALPPPEGDGPGEPGERGQVRAAGSEAAKRS
jgi:small-conductance mechanosensitive channel